MRACLAIPSSLPAICPTCETGDETHQTWVSFQTDSEEQIESLLLVPTKPSQTSFQDPVPLSEPYRVLSPVEAEEEVVLQPMGPFSRVMTVNSCCSWWLHSSTWTVMALMKPGAHMTLLTLLVISTGGLRRWGEILG